MLLNFVNKEDRRILETVELYNETVSEYNQMIKEYDVLGIDRAEPIKEINYNTSVESIFCKQCRLVDKLINQVKELSVMVADQEYMD